MGESSSDFRWNSDFYVSGIRDCIMDSTRRSGRLADKASVTATTFPPPDPIHFTTVPSIPKVKKTAAQRNREYRARIKADPQKAAAFKEKNRLRSLEF